MFHAFVIVCAASMNQVYYDTCFRLDDAWGPFYTEENCIIRSRQMAEEIVYGDLNPHVTNFYIRSYGSSPEMLYAEAQCEPTDDTVM